MGGIKDGGQELGQGGAFLAAMQTAGSGENNKCNKVEGPSRMELHHSGNFSPAGANAETFQTSASEFAHQHSESSSPWGTFQAGYSPQNVKPAYTRHPMQPNVDSSPINNEFTPYKSIQADLQKAHPNAISAQAGHGASKNFQMGAYPSMLQYRTAPPSGIPEGYPSGYHDSHFPQHHPVHVYSTAVPQPEDPIAASQMKPPYVQYVQVNPHNYQNFMMGTHIHQMQHNAQPWYQGSNIQWQQDMRQPQQWQHVVQKDPRQPIGAHYPGHIVYPQDITSRMDYADVKPRPPLSKIPRLTKAAWNSHYQNFMQSMNLLYDRPPTLFGRSVDPYHLFYAVVDAGGFQKVSAENSWGMISDRFGLDRTGDIPMALSAIYQKYLHRFEDHLPKALEASVVNAGSKMHLTPTPLNECLQPQYARQRLVPGGQLMNLQAKTQRSDHDLYQGPFLARQSQLYGVQKPDMPIHDSSRFAMQKHRTYPEFQHPNNPAASISAHIPPNVEKSQKPYPLPRAIAQDPYHIYVNQRGQKYCVPQSQVPQFQQHRSIIPSASPSIDGAHHKPDYPAFPLHHQVNARKKPSSIRDPQNHIPTQEGKKEVQADQSAAMYSGQSPRGDDKNDYFVFRPRIYNIETYGGLDLSAIGSVFIAPPTGKLAYEEPIDIDRVIMSIKSRLDLEIKYALDSLFVLSKNESLEFSLDQFSTLFDLLILIAEGKLFNSEHHNESVVLRELDESTDELSEEDCNGGLGGILTASLIVCGESSEKEPKELKHHEKESKPLSNVQFVLLSYPALLKCENVRVNGIQNTRASAYEVICSENRELRVISAETILRNFSFASLNQRFLGRSRRFCRLLISMLTSGAFVRKKKCLSQSSISVNDEIHNLDFNTNGLGVQISDSEVKIPNSLSSCDEGVDFPITLDDENNSLIPETIILSKNPDIAEKKLTNLDGSFERRINGLTILSNIGFHYHMKSELEAQIIWSTIFDFLTDKDIPHSYAALEALTKLTLIYENAKFFSKIKKMTLIIDKILSMLPSESCLTFKASQTAKKIQVSDISATQSYPKNAQGSISSYNVKQHLFNHLHNPQYDTYGRIIHERNQKLHTHPELAEGCIVFQPVLNESTQEEISLWEMASMALLHIVLIDEASVKQALVSSPKLMQKLVDLVNAPSILISYNISPSLMPVILSLCIRSLRILLECLKDSTLCSMAQVYEQSLLQVLWSLQAANSFDLPYENNTKHYRNDGVQHHSADGDSPFLLIETLVCECLGLLGRME